MKRIFNLVKYDYLQRVRTYKFLIILCSSLAFAFLLVPESGANYRTVSIGNYLGHYNAAWIAYVTAMMSSVFISLMGYYIINNSILIDQNTKVGQLVAATDITNFQYLLAKFLGNFLILLTIIICIFFVGIVLFFLYTTGYPLELYQFLLAYLLIPIPAIILISAMAIFLEVIFKKKSVLQNTVFFILFGIMLTQGWMGINGDAFGTRYPTQEMERLVEEVTSSSENHHINIGFVIRQYEIEKRFHFPGIPISTPYVLSRFLWPVIGFLLVFLSSKFFHRFELSDRSSEPSSQPNDVETFEFQEINISSMPLLEKYLGIWPVCKLEFLMLIRKGKRWLWVLNLLGITLLAFIPIGMAHQYVLPILWFLQVHRWADLISKERASQMHYFVYSSFRPVQRLLTAQYFAGISLAIFLALPLIVRYTLLSQWQSILAILCGAVFIIGLSAFTSISTGGKRLFEILFFFITYLNINGMPYTDYFGALNPTVGYLACLTGLTLALISLSFFVSKIRTS